MHCRPGLDPRPRVGDNGHEVSSTRVIVPQMRFLFGGGTVIYTAFCELIAVLLPVWHHLP